MAIPVVDARDVARMHRLALESGAPSGGRYLGVADTMWLIEIARALRERLGAAARRAPTRVLPDWAVRLVGIFDPAARLAVPELGKYVRADNTATRRALAMQFMPGADAAAAMGRSLIDLGLA
jgi:dihydroflavonol-4-reductase